MDNKNLTRLRPRNRRSQSPRRLAVLLAGVAALTLSATATPATAVIGGQDAANDQYPWNVSVRTNGHRCGGVIYNGSTVLTAAQCVDGLNPKDLSIRYGTLTHASGGTDVGVKDVIMHPDYDSWAHDNDIAVLHPDTPLIKGENARSVCLPEPGSDPAEGTVATLTGWGATRVGGTIPQRLQKVDLSIVDRATLRSDYSGSYDIANNMIGASYSEAGRGAAHKDEGSPLTVQNSQTGAATLLGIYSWGSGNASPHLPAVFTNVSPYADNFIADNIVHDDAFPHAPCGK
ncbi:serine protease [Streptomyces sp. BH055]|uniref:serine protease n=1 Tax=unclassified Streptomyces TaxID=2593676 RepID=UPI003BB533B1